MSVYRTIGPLVIIKFKINCVINLKSTLINFVNVAIFMLKRLLGA